MTDNIKDLALHHGIAGPFVILLALAAALFLTLLVLAIVTRALTQLGQAFAKGWRKAGTTTDDTTTTEERA